MLFKKKIKPIRLFSTSDEMVKAWKEAFNGFEDVSIYKKDILSIPADAVISPVNSFG